MSDLKVKSPFEVEGSLVYALTERGDGRVVNALTVRVESAEIKLTESQIEAVTKVIADALNGAFLVVSD